MRPNHRGKGRGQNCEAEATTTRPRLATCRYMYFSIRTHGDNANNTITEFVSHIRVLNHLLIMNVAMIQPRNGYNQYYYRQDATKRQTVAIKFIHRPKISILPHRGDLLHRFIWNFAQSRGTRVAGWCFCFLVLHWTAHSQGQLNETEARPRSNARGRGQNFGLYITAAATVLAILL